MIHWRSINSIKRRLPKSSGILGREKYFNSAVLVPIVDLDGELHLLFQKRAPHIRQGSDICFPGGRYDDTDRSYRETAIRETVEELGVKRKQIKIIGKLHTLVAHMGAVIEPYVGILKISSLNELKINRDEVDSVSLIPINWFIETEPEEYQVRVEIKSRITHDNGDESILLPVDELELAKDYNESWGSNRPVWVYKTDFGSIWGLTAEIILELLKYLRG